MPTPYPFQSGATLLASQMNSLSQLPTVSITANSTAVATHAYSRIVANGSAITYTIPNSVFEAGQVIEFHNINSTACTIAAGAGVTLNGAAGLTVAQYQAATIYATSASSFILFESDVTQTAAGLELVKSQTIGNAVSSVTVTDAFSATYDAYRIVVCACDASSDGQALTFQLGSSTASYHSTTRYFFTDGTTASAQRVNQASAYLSPSGANTETNLSMDVFSPNLAAYTTFSGAGFASNEYAIFGGAHKVATAYTAFTLGVASGTLTGGTIRVYGYKN